MIGHGHQQVQVNPKILNVLAKQQHELVTKPPDCVMFIANPDGDILDIQADIIGPVGTPYEGGVFKCKLVIDAEFPQKPPKGYFLTKIFHPNVAVPSGEICVNTLKKDWNPASWSLSHIFEVIKCLLIVPFPESSLNEEAGREFMENYDDFFKNAKVYTSVHAKLQAHHLKYIEQHHKPVQHSHEEQKQQVENMVIDSSGCSGYVGQHQTGFGSGKEVLSQVTNSFVPAQAFEGKGDIMGGLQEQSLGSSGAAGMNKAINATKKSTAVADSKKKWMRRI